MSATSPDAVEPHPSSQWTDSDVEEEPLVDVVRDPKYYFDDGDFVVRVDDVLFKVHRFLLSRDSSAFNDMFSFPAGTCPVGQEGSSDDAPLVLSDTKDEFRALLWVLYALPSELQIGKQADGTAPHDIGLLLSVAEITNKYHFTSIESWATTAVLATVCTHSFDTNSSPLLTRIVTVAFRSNHTELQNAIIDVWLKLLLTDEMSPIPAISVSEHFALRKLQGMAYYTQLILLERTIDLGSFPRTEPLSFSGLSEQQLLRLLSGHMSLTMYSGRLYKNPISFVPRAECTPTRHARCVQMWKFKWQTAMMTTEMLNLGTTHVLSRLYLLQSMLANDRDLMGLDVFFCRDAALAALGTLIDEAHSGLWQHFTGFSWRR